MITKSRERLLWLRFLVHHPGWSHRILLDPRFLRYLRGVQRAHLSADERWEELRGLPKGPTRLRRP